VYAADPVEVAARWAHQGARWLHVVDLEGTLTGHPVQLGLIRSIAAVGVPIQVDGGVRAVNHLEEVLDAGGARVLLGIDALAIVEEASRQFGERVAVSLGVRDGRVAVGEDRTTNGSGVTSDGHGTQGVLQSSINQREVELVCAA